MRYQAGKKNKRKAINTFQLFWSFSSDGRESPKAMSIVENLFFYPQYTAHTEDTERSHWKAKLQQSQPWLLLQ